MHHGKAPTGNTPQKLDMVWLELTSFCNLECVHCYANSGPTGKQAVVSDEKYRQLITEAAQLGCSRLQFIGGEPTAHKALPSLIAHARASGIRSVEVFTNATMITEKLLECFVAHDVSVLVSFYSYDQAAHDKITKHNKSFQKTVDGIGRLIFNNVPTTVCVIEMDINKGHFQHTKSFLTNLGVNNVHFDAIRGVGRGVGVSGPSRDINSERAGKPELALSELCGQCGNGKLAILPDGSVSPCVMARSRTVGSALETSLDELLGGIQMERFRSELRKLKSVGETASSEETEFTKIVRVPDQCSPHTNTEPMCSPGMPQPDQCSPHTNTEPMCGPGMPQPDQCSPHTNTEPMCGPGMPQPDQCSPHTNTEPMCSPGMPQPDQCSPHTNTEPMCSPGMPQPDQCSPHTNTEPMCGPGMPQPDQCSPHTNTEPMCSPGMPQPDQCSPHTNTEPMCGPGMPQPDQCSPHTNTEPMCGPGMPQPDQCSPHTNTEPMCGPGMPQPDQCSPHTNTEPMCSPGMPQPDQCSPHTNTEPMCSPGMPQSEPISRLFNNFEVGRAPIILESAASNSEIYSFQLLGIELCDKLVSIISKYQYRKSAIGSGIFMENRNSEDLIADEGYEILKMNFEKATMPIFNSVAKTLWSWDCNAIVDLSLVKYETGCYFKEHVDAYNGKTQAKRHISFIVYLSDEFEGGETYFRRQGQTIYPRRGKAVMFPSGVTHPHEGRTVKSGTKFAVVGWLTRL